MAKSYSHKRRSHSKSRTMRRGQRGGDLGGNPASAWGWGMGTLGGGWTQFMNSLTLQPGQNFGAAQSNAIVPVGNVNAQTAQGNIGPGMGGDVPQSGGKRRRHRHRSHKRSARRGGNIGAVLSQAAVPGVLLVAQQTYGKSRKHRRH